MLPGGSELLTLIGIFLVIAIPIAITNKIKNEAYIKKLKAMNQSQLHLEMSRLQSNLQKYKTNHILHLLLTIFMLGVWIVPWILISSSNSSTRKKIETMMDKIVETPNHLDNEKVA